MRKKILKVNKRWKLKNLIKAKFKKIQQQKLIPRDREINYK